MKASKSVLLILVLLVCIPLLVSCIKKPEEDYAMYKNMQEYLLQKFQAMPGFNERAIAEDFEDYVLNLTLLPRLVFGNRQLEVHLYPEESTHMATGCISQFEVPPDSENFTDVAFVVRPNANLRAPYMHGDALKGMAGMSTSFSMDFYNVNMAEIDVDTFFGDQIDKLTQGLALVAQYQRTGEDRGKYTRHLDPYKSDYRIEIEIPDTDVEAELQAYHDSALAAFKLFADAYLTALARLEPEDDADLISGTKAGTDVFINTLLEEDTAAKLGLLLFKEEAAFSHYFNEGFWRAGYYGPGL